MGKATKWFRGLLGLKKSEPNSDPTQKPPPKKKWSFGRNSKGKDRLKSKTGISTGGDSDEDASRHAIAVASATAAVAEAAVAAAQAAAAVVKLTSGGGSASTTGSSGGLRCAAYVSQRGARNVNREEWAAVMIQSHFRAYLSRRALRALRALVKLQALVRGHIMRKRWANYLRQMQAMLRAQARARAGRALICEATNLNTKSPPSPEIFERIIQNRSMKKPEQLIRLKRNGSKSNGNIIYDHEKSNPSHHRMTRRSWDEKAEKILEVDTGKPLAPPTRRNISRSSHLSHSSDKYCQTTTAFSSSSGEVQSLSPLKFAQKDITVDEGAFWTAENSPQYYSASSVGASTSHRGAFTPPTKSLSGYSDHPNYMAYTASSKAKVRSLSAPKQRESTQYERLSSINRYSVHGYGDLRSNPQKKCYPGSGRLDGFGFPVGGGDCGRYSSGQWV